MGRLLFRGGVAAQDQTVILVDTSVIVAWMDGSHPEHEPCQRALLLWAGRDQLAVSSVTYAELAAGARAQEGVDEALSLFQRLDLDFDASWRAGQRFRQYRPAKGEEHPVLPDFFIRGQAATRGLVHLTNDRRRLTIWPEVEFVFAGTK